MKLTFRWYGDNDPVTLDHIRQIPMMTGIVSAIYNVPAGGVWSRESIAENSSSTSFVCNFSISISFFNSLICCYLC